MRTTVGQLRRALCELLLSPQKVRDAWEDLFVGTHHGNRYGTELNLNPGKVSFNDLVNQLGTSPQAVKQALQHVGLMIDRHGNVVDGGLG